MATKDDWIHAGQIAAEVREWSKKLIKPGEKLVEVADQIDNKINEKAATAFPVSLAINECAAHYAPMHQDPIIITEDMCIKIDLGVCVNGAIGDTAYTVDLTKKYSDMVKASIEARDNALKLITPGVTLGEIGKTIIETIQSYDNFTPIVNLSGHGLGEYLVHTSPSIPNYDTGDKTELKSGMTIAIEPFATNGAGKIKESGNPNIFSQTGNKPVRDIMSRNIMKEISNFNNLPFASRWLCEKFHPSKVNFALRMLQQAGNLHGYPPLVEIKEGMVTQSEHSAFVEEDGCTILTE